MKDDQGRPVSLGVCPWTSLFIFLLLLTFRRTEPNGREKGEKLATPHFFPAGVKIIRGMPRPRRRAAAFGPMRRWFFHGWGGEMDRDLQNGFSLRDCFSLRISTLPLPADVAFTHRPYAWVTTQPGTKNWGVARGEKALTKNSHICNHQTS